MGGLVCAIALVVLVVLCVAIAAIAGLARAAASKHGGARDYGRFAERAAPPFEEFCFPKSYAVQLQQAFLGEFMSPAAARDRSGDSILVFHRIGAGKTCAAIQIAERWARGARKPLVVMPASLIPGFRNELRSGCAGDSYVSAGERALLSGAERARVLEASDARIDAVYDIVSYNAVHAWNGRPSVLIIDEVQNVLNSDGAWFRELDRVIEHNPRMPVVCMTATPVFDDARELVSLARLMRLKLPAAVRDRAVPIALSHVRAAFAGRVSFYAGAPAYTFPRTSVEVREVPMSKFQARWYNKIAATEFTKIGTIRAAAVTNSFYMKTRQLSNVVFPLGLAGEDGLAELARRGGLDRSRVGAYSAKAAAFLDHLAENSGLAFAYSGFTGAYGIGFFTAVLRAAGWRDFAVDGPGADRYAVWSGAESLAEKDQIREVFNSTANDHGSQIRLVFGSPAIKEGVSLLRVRHVYVFEGYWNHSRLEQVFGRAVRYCSHKTLAPAERKVAIHIYASVAPGAGGPSGAPRSIDLFMLGIADEKLAEAAPFIDELAACAVDLDLHVARGPSHPARFLKQVAAD